MINLEDLQLQRCDAGAISVPSDEKNVVHRTMRFESNQIVLRATAVGRCDPSNILTTLLHYCCSVILCRVISSDEETSVLMLR
jgi:hypothetical protein